MSPQRGGRWPEQCLFTALALLGAAVLVTGGLVMALRLAVVAVSGCVAVARRAAHVHDRYNAYDRIKSRRFDNWSADALAEVVSDFELPGQWTRADVEGGDPDERSHSERAVRTEVRP